MKKYSKYFVILLALGTLSFFNVERSYAQTSVYVCSTTGAYGFCYGGTNVSDCAYKKCIDYGGKTPYLILNVSSKGYGAIAVGQDANGAQVVGASAGYSSQTDADNRALSECQNRGGTGTYIAHRFSDY